MHPKEKLQVRFLCLVFMNKDLLVTGGSNGFLYIFKKGVLIEEQIGHLKSPILCIDKSQFHENFFVTGGQDGSVNLWEIRNYQDSNVIEKLFEYNIYKNGKGLYDKASLVDELDQEPSDVHKNIHKIHKNT
jgi:WD40 repeat protein